MIGLGLGSMVTFPGLEGIEYPRKSKISRKLIVYTQEELQRM